MITIETIITTELGDRSYVAHDGATAIVIDPRRDIDRVESLLVQLELTCALVLETHIHNDYVTGGLVLAKRSGATYVVAADAVVDFERHSVANGDELSAGSLSITVVATPGHTEDHLSFVVSDAEGPTVVFTGGSLLYGSVGRTDFVDPAKTEQLTHAQYRSAQQAKEVLVLDVRRDDERAADHVRGSLQRPTRRAPRAHRGVAERSPLGALREWLPGEHRVEPARPSRTLCRAHRRRLHQRGRTRSSCIMTGGARGSRSR